MHSNIGLRHATAALLDQVAESLSVAQRHCLVIMYVVMVRRIRLFNSPFSKQTRCCAHVTVNSSVQSHCNHNPSLFPKAPAQPLPKPQNSKKLLCDAVDSHILLQDRIDGICAVYHVDPVRGFLRSSLEGTSYSLPSTTLTGACGRWRRRGSRR